MVRRRVTSGRRSEGVLFGRMRGGSGRGAAGSPVRAAASTCWTLPQPTSEPGSGSRTSQTAPSPSSSKESSARPSHVDVTRGSWPSLATCAKKSTCGRSRLTATGIFCSESRTSRLLTMRPSRPRSAARLWIVSSRVWMYMRTTFTSGSSARSIRSRRAYHEPCRNELSTSMLRRPCRAATRLNSVRSPASRRVMRAAEEESRAK
mmetsp:Transcript_4951/g.15989  ORF Transcript_4951/g.15989 Transcript_4951/m.15989 type:complete len:205 (-) Transcript_4951:125-739(-)